MAMHLDLQEKVLGICTEASLYAQGTGVRDSDLDCLTLEGLHHGMEILLGMSVCLSP